MTNHESWRAQKGQIPKRVTKIGIARAGTHRFLRRYGRKNDYSFIDSDRYNLICESRKGRNIKFAASRYTGLSKVNLSLC